MVFTTPSTSPSEGLCTPLFLRQEFSHQFSMNIIRAAFLSHMCMSDCNVSVGSELADTLVSLIWWETT